MEISNLAASETPIAPVCTDAKIAQLQVALLRKTLESQQEQSAELLRMMEGKGRIVDLRV